MNCINIASVFGPLGKLKVITNETGGIMITRDGHAIVPHCIHGLHGDFTKFIFKQCIASSFARGDGLLTVLLVTSSFTSALRESVKRHSQPMQSRIKHLRAIETLCMIELERAKITAHHVAAGIWRHEMEMRQRIQTLCWNVVVPAANVDICDRIISILNRWLQTNEVAVTCVANQVRAATDMFDVLVHKSVGTRSPSPSDPVLQFIGDNDLLIRGRCRDYGAVAQHSAGASGFAVLFIKELALGADKVIEHCIQLTAISDVLSATRSYTQQLERLVLMLKATESSGPFIILCSCKLEDQAVHLLSNSGIILIDSVPAECLAYGSRRAGCSLFENIDEFIQKQGQQGKHVDSTLQEGDISGSARCACVERVILGSTNEVHYLLRGITEVRGNAHSMGHHDTCAQKLARENLPQQLILHGNSAMSVGVYVSMLRRCLKALSSSVSAPVRSTAFCQEPDAASFDEVLVPGAGAGELSWALLWSQVASYLSQCNMNEIRSGSADRALHGDGALVPCADTDADLSTALAPLVEYLGTKIAFQLAQTCPTALPECVAVCEMLSTAYEQVPLALLANASDVLPQALSSGADAASRHDVHRAMLLWKQRLQSAGPGRGCIGLVVNSDLDAEEVCTLEGFVSCGVACSGHQFWSVFTEVRELARLQLRVGGEDGVIRVKSSRLRSRSKHRSRDNEESDDSSS